MKINTKVQYNHIDTDILKNHNEIIDLYNSHYDIFRLNHPIYQKGWSSNFFSPHRFLNRIVYQIILENCKSDKIIDHGCYDGMLIKLLADKKIDITGKEDVVWTEMYDLLNIKNKINSIDNMQSIVISLNYVHRIPISKLIPFMKQQYPNMKILFCDRCPTNKQCYQNEYFQPHVLEKYRLEKYSFPNCNITKDSKAELLIWKD